MRAQGGGVLALVLCLALGQSGDAGWQRVEPGLTLRFPEDHGAHPRTRIEWWYLTGHLADEAGAEYGFQFTVFRRGLELPSGDAAASPLRARAAWAGHLALTDVARGETRFAERLARSSPLAGASLEDLDVHLEDWSLARVASDGGEELRLAAADPVRAFGLELVLRPEKPLVLHGDAGYSRKGAEPGNASAYVSWTRLSVAGTVHLDGSDRRVHGQAWFDHEFGSSVLAEGAVGWDWFSLQLEDAAPGDGRDLMLFVLRDGEGRPLEASAGTLVDRRGRPRPLRSGDFRLRATETWTSPRTGTRYPSGWTIALPAEGLELVLTPLVPDCELLGESSTGVRYWEGPVRVSGSCTGRGYAELTGYGTSMQGRF